MSCILIKCLIIEGVGAERMMSDSPLRAPGHTTALDQVLFSLSLQISVEVFFTSFVMHFPLLLVGKNKRLVLTLLMGFGLAWECSGLWLKLTVLSSLAEWHGTEPGCIVANNGASHSGSSLAERSETGKNQQNVQATLIWGVL